MYDQPPPIPNAATPDPGFGGTPYVSSNGRLVDPTTTPDQRQYATLMHLTLLLAIIMPVLGVIAPLGMWLAKKDQSRFIDDHGKETLNFHISVLIYFAISGLLLIVVIGVPMLIAACLLALIGMIKASTAANRGEYYRYPACIRLIH